MPMTFRAQLTTASRFAICSRIARANATAICYRHCMAGSATTQLLGRKEVRENYGRLRPSKDWESLCGSVQQLFPKSLVKLMLWDAGACRCALEHSRG